MHLVPLAAIFTGVGWFEIGLCAGLYAGRMFFVTAGFHRYFAHRTYKMNRVMQFLMALGGTTAVQKGVLWWAGYHRNHHLYSDTEKDTHSPLRGFWWSHMGWILCDKYFKTPTHLIEDFSKYPELRWLNKNYLLPPIALGAAIFFLWGPSALFIGFFLSTVLLSHGTFMINSMAHVIGKRRYVTNDTSRNNFLLALITGGEGWHNNHHHYRSSANQGFFWWELDSTYYVLKIMSWFGLVKDLRKPPKAVLASNRVKDGHFDIGLFQSRFARATHVVQNAKRYTEKYVEAKKREMEDLLEATKGSADELLASTKEKAEELARLSRRVYKSTNPVPPSSNA
ncbi:acyl-CoA desaturase [Patescibacteria group bacterium]|nr:acyl-CoA desaturase [Patescibacteria group bacterium]